jgi:hypothetical protein
MNNEEKILSILQEIRDQQERNFEHWKIARDEAFLISKKAGRKTSGYFVFAGLCLLGLFLLSNDLFFSGHNDEELDDLSILKNRQLHDAKGWLSSNQNPSPLASNRFTTKADSLEFVELLYSSGAEMVYVANVMSEDWRIKEEGGPYSNSIVVVLPTEKEMRRKIFKISATEAKREGFDPTRDIGQKELFFWWD